MTILVLGGTGRVGSAAIANLVAAGRPVRTISRDVAKLAAVPEGVDTLVADLDDPASLTRAFADVDAVLLSLAVHPDEARRGFAAIAAAKAAGVRKIVHISVKHYPHSDDKLFYQGKQLIERELARSGLITVILRPANFHQSDSGMVKMIADQGIYPPPVGTVGIDRIDSRDVGHAAARALLQDDFDDQEAELYGPETFTGPRVAHVYSEVLGREVRYNGDDLETWNALNKDRLGEWYRTALRSLYIQQQAYGMRRPDGVPQHPLLPADLRTFQSYARELFEQ